MIHYRQVYYYEAAIWASRYQQGRLSPGQEFNWKQHVNPEKTYLPSLMWYQKHTYWFPIVQRTYLTLSVSICTKLVFHHPSAIILYLRPLEYQPCLHFLGHYIRVTLIPMQFMTLMSFN